MPASWTGCGCMSGGSSIACTGRGTTCEASGCGRRSRRRRIGVVRSTGILPMLRGRLRAGLRNNRTKRTQSTPDRGQAVLRPGRRDKRYRVKRSQFPPSTGAGGDGRGRRRSRRWDCWYKRSQFADMDGNRRGPAQRPAGAVARPNPPNEPNLSPRRWAQPTHTPMLGAIVPNEANFPFDSSGRGCREVGGGVVVVTACTNEPNFRRGAGISVDRPSRPSRPRRSPNVSNEANPPAQWKGKLPCGKRVMTNLAAHGLRRTSPIFGTGRCGESGVRHRVPGPPDLECATKFCGACADMVLFLWQCAGRILSVSIGWQPQAQLGDGRTKEVCLPFASNHPQGLRP